MSYQIPLPPGMTVDKDESDSDPEVQEAQRKRRADAAQREAQRTAASKAAEDKAARLKAEAADKAHMLQSVCKQDGVDKVHKFLSDTDQARPAAFDERLRLAEALHEAARGKFQASESAEAVLRWLAVVHCLDFTPNEMSAQSADDHSAVRRLLLRALSNLSLDLRPAGVDRAAEACRAAELGLAIAQELPYKDSKPFRVKLRYHRALGKAALRDFAGAREDLGHVLQLDPDHAEARRVMRNCEVALRREGGPKEGRWKGPITLALPVKAKPQDGLASWWKVGVVVVIGPVLAFYALRVLWPQASYDVPQAS